MTVEEFPPYRKLVVFFIALWLYCAISPSLALAADPIPICEILDEPTRFHLRQVTLQGTVRDVQPLNAYTLTVGSTCYGAYLFYLKNETASVNVASFGSCGIPTVRDPDVEDGTPMELQATIQAPSHGGYYLSF